MIEKGLNQHNFMPGTERYTRPEEVKALNKFLKSVKEIQDEHTEVSNDNLAVPDSSTRVPGVTELDKTRINIDGVLSQTLEEKLKTISTSLTEGTTLDTSSVGNEETTSLDNSVSTLDVNEDQELSNTRLDIEPKEDQELEDTRLDISENSIESLEDTVLGLEKNEDQELSNTRLNITEDSKVDSLEDMVLDLSAGEDPELSDTKLDISENKVDSLDNSKINITKSEDQELNDKVVSLSGSENPELSKTKVEISEDSKVDSLEDTKIGLSRGNDIDLSEESVKLSAASKVETLNDTIISGPIASEQDLEKDSISLLSDSKVSELSEDRIDINPAQDNSLSKSRINLEKEDKVNSLEDYIENLGTENIVNSLDTTLIQGPEPNDQDLETSSVSLEDSEKISALDSTIITGPGENNPGDLENTSVSLDSENEISSLEDYIENLGAEDLVNSLDTTIIQGPESSGLEGRTTTEDYNISGVELETTSLGITGNEEIDSLEKDYIKNPDGYDIGSRTITDLDKTVKDPEYALSQVSVSSKKDKADITILENGIEALEEQDTNFNIKNPDGYDLGNRTILDLDKTVKDPEYILSQVSVSSKKDKADETIDKNEKVESLEKDYIKNPEGYDLSNRTITDLDKTVKDPEYALSQVSVSSKKDKSDITILKNEVEELDTNFNVKNPKGYTRSNRTITDLDTWVEDPEYILSQVSVSSRDGIPEVTLSEEAGHTKDNRWIEDLDKTIKDPEYEISQVSLSGDPKYKTPDTKTKSQVNSISDIGELHVSDMFKSGRQSGEHGYLTPGYKLPEIGWKNFWNGGALNPSTYLRWATENTIGKIPLRGTYKRKLIDETLALLVIAREKLEKAAKGNRDRLPGDDMGLLSDLASGKLTVKSATKSIVGAVGKALSKSEVDRSKPINRPSNKKNSDYSWEAPGQEVLDSETKSNKTSTGLFNRLLGGNVTDANGAQTRTFRNMMDLRCRGLDSNMKEVGLGATMYDLVSARDISDTTSFSEFKDILKQSRYITSPNKFTTTSDSTNYMTLDSNHIWEIKFRPYVGGFNGNKTWLPSFYEIDVLNKCQFNMTTHFSSGWLPITGFELQDKKLTSRELPLFNGSISYPVGLEFTNELRLTFADDSLKSLRRYFDLCTKVSTYMSNIHTSAERGYNAPVDNLSGALTNPTVYLDGKVHPGLYKNLTFLVDIFILSPQYAVIKKCTLLCVIKDYTIENQGEVDSSPTELSVTFSIVGENPKVTKEERKKSTTENSYTPPKKTSKKDRTGEGLLDNLGSLVNIF